MSTGWTVRNFRWGRIEPPRPVPADAMVPPFHLPPSVPPRTEEAYFQITFYYFLLNIEHTWVKSICEKKTIAKQSEGNIQATLSRNADKCTILTTKRVKQRCQRYCLVQLIKTYLNNWLLYFHSSKHIISLPFHCKITSQW